MSISAYLQSHQPKYPSPCSERGEIFVEKDILAPGCCRQMSRRCLCLPVLSLALRLAPKAREAASGDDMPPGPPLAAPEISAICMSAPAFKSALE